MTNMWKFLTATAVVALCSVVPVGGQTCDDFDECTSPDMCAEGECTGTPVSGGSCDDNNECTDPDSCAAGVCTGAPLNGVGCDDDNPCTTDDTCVTGMCQGTPAENGTGCGVGPNTECGLCLSGACQPNVEKQGAPCTDVLGNCTTNDLCIGTFCLGTLITCPDSDGNKCTAEVCNPVLSGGTCIIAGPVPCGSCATCDGETGDCAPANEGLECDDSNACNETGTCQTGSCVLGIPGGTATPTFTPIFTPTGTPVGTATATITATPTGPTPTDTPILTPVSTATGTPTGTVSPIVTATGTPTGTVSATVTATVTNTSPPTSTATATPPGPTNTPTVTRTGTVTSTPLPIVATIIVGSAAGVPGGTVSFSVTLDTTAEVSGTQNDITFDADARIPADDEGDPRCTVNPAIDKAETTFAFLPTDCTPGTTCTGVRAVVISFDNLDAIPTGSVLYTCEVVIAEDAVIGGLPLTCSNPGAGDPDAMRLGADCTNGIITVTAPGNATIVVDEIEGQPGNTIELAVTLQTADQVADTENDITFAPQAPIAGEDGSPQCVVNSAINKDATFAFLPTGCSVGTTCTGVHAEIISSTNDDPIPNGATLYTCQVEILATAASGTYPLTCSNPVAAAPNGAPVNATCVNGEVVVLAAPTATATATRTLTAPTPPTATATVSQTSGSPTATSTVAPPTATRTVSTSGTPTRTITPATPTRSATPRPSNDDDGCAIVAPEPSGGAWVLLVPVALLLSLRRRRR